jgi:predicted MFS family arabinose efflux permease
MLKAAIVADWRLLVYGMLMTFWSSPGQTYLISLFGGEIRAAFSLTHGQFGSIYSAGTLLSAFTLMWTGRLVDRLPLRTISLAVVLFLALGCAWMYGAMNVAMLVSGIFILRQAGQGLMTLTAATAMVRYFEQIKGRASAISHLGFSLAEATLPAMVISAIGLVGWRHTWLMLGGALLLLLPLLALLLKNHARRHAGYLAGLEARERAAAGSVAARSWTRQEVLRDPRFYLYMPAQLCPSFFFTGFFFHQIYIVETKGWNLAGWAAQFAAYAVASLLTTIASGPLVDRLGPVRHAPWFCLPLGTGLFLLSSGDHFLLAPAFLILTGITSGWNPTVVGPFWADMYGTRHLAAIKSMGTALMVFSSALSPFVLGLLFDSGYALEDVALASSAIILACALLAHQALAETRRGMRPD